MFSSCFSEWFSPRQDPTGHFPPSSLLPAPALPQAGMLLYEKYCLLAPPCLSFPSAKLGTQSLPHLPLSAKTSCLFAPCSEILELYLPMGETGNIGLQIRVISALLLPELLSGSLQAALGTGTSSHPGRPGGHSASHASWPPSHRGHLHLRTGRFPRLGPIPALFRQQDPWLRPPRRPSLIPPPPGTRPKGCGVFKSPSFPPSRHFWQQAKRGVTALEQEERGRG